jgi:hypothetical protein
MTHLREFTMHLRCSNCVRPSVQTVAVPRVEEAPSTIDEFLSSAAMTNVPFHCRHCEGTSGILVAVTLEGECGDEWEAPAIDAA